MIDRISDSRIRQISEMYARAQGKAIIAEFGKSSGSAEDTNERLRKIVNEANIIKSRRRSHKALRNIVAALLVLTISTGGVLAFSEDARAMVRNWYREIIGDHIVYHFEGEDNGKEIKTPILGWIPEGFEVSEKYQDENIYDITYIDNNENILGISFYRIGILDISEIITSEDNLEIIYINGIEAEFYEGTKGNEGSILFWQDDENNVICEIDSNLEKDIIFKVAENITFPDS